MNNLIQNNQSRVETKMEKNDRYRKQYPAFMIPTSSYEVIYINKYTTSVTMNKLIKHVQHCNDFTIDTEGERSNNELALIQIQTLPRNASLVIILIEIMHLPLNDTIIYGKIKQCLELIFKSENNLYGWGELIVELKPAIKYELFNWPIKSTIYDIQRYFPQWYIWALSHCEICSLSSSQSRVVDVDVNVNSRTTINVLSKCTCHAKSPYRVGEKWGLQEALVYTGQMFLDKSMTRNHWSLTLDPDHSILSKRTRNQMVSYAIYDCFTTSYLAYPVLQYWTFQQVAKIDIANLFQTSPSSSLHHGYNNIKNDTQVNKQLMKNIIVDGAVFISDDSDQSDEEIFINRCNDQFNNDLLNKVIPNGNKEDDILLVEAPLDELDDIHELNEEEKLYDEQQLSDTKLIVNNHYVVDDVREEELPPVKKRRTHQQRSEEYRKRKNRKRSAVQKQRRYHYSIRRRWYPRFPLPMVRRILRLYKINYTHVNDDGDELKIGVKDRASERAAEHQLPASIFNYRSYLHYRKTFRS